VLLSSSDSFPHLIQKRRSQLGFVTYLLNYLRTIHNFGAWVPSSGNLVEQTHAIPAP